MQFIRINFVEFLLIYVQINLVVSRVNESELLPYSEESGSKRFVFGYNNDQFIPLVGNNFPFLGTIYNNLYIYGNGYIAFEGRHYTSSYSSCLLNGLDLPAIAVYLSNSKNDEHDESRTGKLLYRQDTTRSSLDRVAIDVRKAFPNMTTLRLTWMLIVTWYNVAPSDQSRYSLRNTFQALLTTDGTASFVLFYYNNITWPNNDAFPDRATAGLFGGKNNTENIYRIPGSCTCSLENIVEMSNIDVPGKFVFRVDQTIVHPSVSTSCQMKEKFLSDKRASRRVHFTPSIITLVGTTPLFAHGLTLLCVNHSIKNVSCVFRGPNSDLEVVAKGEWIQGNFAVFCIKPDTAEIGKLDINITVTFSDSNKIYAWGSIFVVPEAPKNIEIELHDSVEHRNTYITTKWNSSDPDSLLDIQTFFNFPIKLPFANSKQVSVRFLELNRNVWKEFSSKSVVNNGSAIMNYSHDTLTNKFLLDNVQTILRAVSISKVTSLSKNHQFHTEHFSDILRSTLVFAKFKISNPKLENVHDKQCQNWYKDESRTKSDTLPCPYNLDQAQMDLRFHESRLFAAQGELNPLDFSVYIQSVPSLSGAGSQCAYNDKGELVLEPPYGSRMHRHSPSNQNNYWEFYRSDIIPYLDCCVLSHHKNENCKRYYMKLRRPYQNTAYEFPVSFRATGASQVTTLNGTTYLLNAVGAFWLVTYKDNLRFQVFLERYSTSQPEITATVITTAIISFRNPNNKADCKIQISVDSEHGLLIWLNGEPLNFYFNEVLNETGHHDPFILYQSYFTIIMNSHTETKITFQNGLSIVFCGTEQNRSLDIVGSVSRNIVEDINGLIGEIPNGFGNTSNQFGQLFEKWRDSSEQTILEFPTKTAKIRSVSYIDINAIPRSREEILKDVPVPIVVFCNNSDNCMVDYRLTGDKAFSKNAEKSYTAFCKMKSFAKLNVRPRECKSPETISNGAVFDTTFVGSELQYLCKGIYKLRIISVKTGTVMNHIMFTCVPNELIVDENDLDQSLNATWVDLETWQTIENFRIECVADSSTKDNHTITTFEKITDSLENIKAWVVLAVILSVVSTVLWIYMLTLHFHPSAPYRTATRQTDSARGINLLELEPGGRL